MKPAPFDYARAESLDEVVRLLSSHAGNAKIIAGGQSLVPMMNFRFARPELLIDINAIPGLDYHRSEGEALCIGPLTRHATLRESPLVRDSCPLMARAYQYVANATVRNRGTLCGNLCHADPASEMPAVMLTVNATMIVLGPKGRREVRAADFFQGVYATDLATDEMLVEVRIPAGQARFGFGFEEVSVRRGDFALTLTAALLDIRDDHIDSAALTLGGVADRPVRLAALERELKGKQPSRALFSDAGAAAAQAISPSEDCHADATYRRDLIEALVTRSLTRAAGLAPAERSA